MGKIQHFSGIFDQISAIWAKFAHFSRVFSGLRSTWSIFALLGLVVAATAGCGVTGALLRVTCKHQDLEHHRCVVYPKFVREKRG